MCNSALYNRTKLVDEPIVKSLLVKSFPKSDIRFMTNTDCNGKMITYCLVNGAKRSLVVNRNVGKHYKSNNFVVSVDKNRLTVFNDSLFVFVDETANSLYMIDGIRLLSYILNNADRLIPTTHDNVSWLTVPKTDIYDLINDNPRNVIKYSHSVANMFSVSRNEDQYKGV